MPARCGRRGGNAVEFALCLPVVLVMTAGIIDYSVYFARNVAVIQAARDGARAGSIETNAYAATAAEDTARESLDLQGLPRSTASVEATLISVSGDQAVRLAVSVPFEPVVDFPMLPVPERITYTATMRLLAP